MSVTETTKLPNPEGDTCLKKVGRLPDVQRPSGTCAGDTSPPPEVSPAPFTYTPEFVREVPDRPRPTPRQFAGFFDVEAAKRLSRVQKLRRVRHRGLYRAGNTWAAKKICRFLLYFGVLQEVLCDPALFGGECGE